MMSPVQGGFAQPVVFAPQQQMAPQFAPQQSFVMAPAAGPNTFFNGMPVMPQPQGAPMMVAAPAGGFGQVPFAGGMGSFNAVGPVAADPLGGLGGAGLGTDPLLAGLGGPNLGLGGLGGLDPLGGLGLGGLGLPGLGGPQQQNPLMGGGNNMMMMLLMMLLGGGNFGGLLGNLFGGLGGLFGDGGGAGGGGGAPRTGGPNINTGGGTARPPATAGGGATTTGGTAATGGGNAVTTAGGGTTTVNGNGGTVVTNNGTTTTTPNTGANDRIANTVANNDNSNVSVININGDGNTVYNFFVTDANGNTRPLPPGTRPPTQPAPKPPVNNGGQTGKVWGDPHYVGFQGDKFDVQDKGLFSVLSDRDLKLNVEHVDYPKIPGTTVIGRAGLQLGADRILMEATGQGPTLNGQLMELNKLYNLDAGSSLWNGTILKVDTPEYNLEIKDQGDHLDLEKIGIGKDGNRLDGVQPDGLVGMTDDDTPGARKGREGKGANGEGAFDPGVTHNDYRINNGDIFGNPDNPEFNSFDTSWDQAAAPQQQVEQQQAAAPAEQAQPAQQPAPVAAEQAAPAEQAPAETPAQPVDAQAAPKQEAAAA